MTEALLEWIRAHGAPGVVLLVILENLGIPWITAPAYLVAGEIVRTGRMGFWSMVGLITGGHMVGATTAWAIMRAGENALARFFRRNEHTEQAHAWLCRWYEERGALTLFVGRLVGQVRPWASLAAGMARVGVFPFLLWTAFGSAVYSAALLALWLTGVRIWVESPHLRWAVIAVGVIGFFGITVYVVGRHVIGRTDSEDDGDVTVCAAE